MPWVYKLYLTEYRDAELVQSDWETKTPGGVQHANGGVQVSGQVAAIVSVRRNPAHEDMLDLNYVSSISEDREIGSGKVYHLATDTAGDPAESDPL